jgi:hypothetical protein
LKKWGDEPVFGPKVDAFAKQVSAGRIKLSDLPAEVGCSRLMTIVAEYDSTSVSHTGRGNTGWNITVHLTIQYQDATTGETLLDTNGGLTRYCGYLRSPWSTKGSLANELVDSLVAM